jgi:hypothetical protein
MRYLFYALFMALSLNLVGQTCDTTSECTCITDDLNPAGIMLGHRHAAKEWKFSYRYMYMNMHDLMFENKSYNANDIFKLGYLSSPINMRMHMHMLMGMYGFTDKFSVMGMLNYNQMSMDMDMFGTSHNHSGSSSHSHGHSHEGDMSMHSSGISDAEIYAVLNVLDNQTHALWLNAGLGIPTGTIYLKGKNDDMMYPDRRYPYMMQLGSGTLDFIPNIAYLFTKNKFSAGAQAGAILRPFTNALGYTKGNQLSMTGWASYKWLKWISSSARIDNVYSGEIRGDDAQLIQIIEPAAAPFNYGGQVINVYGGLNFYINKTFLRNSKLSIEYGIPLYQYVNNIQLSLKSSIYAGWSFAF